MQTQDIHNDNASRMIRLSPKPAQQAAAVV